MEPDNLEWFYVDRSAQEFGPFPSRRMAQWFAQGFFPIGDKLLVRLREWTRHVPVHNLWPDGAPFSGPPRELPPPAGHGGAPPAAISALPVEHSPFAPGGGHGHHGPPPGAQGPPPGGQGPGPHGLPPGPYGPPVGSYGPPSPHLGSLGPPPSPGPLPGGYGPPSGPPPGYAPSGGGWASSPPPAGYGTGSYGGPPGYPPPPGPYGHPPPPGYGHPPPPGPYGHPGYPPPPMMALPPPGPYGHYGGGWGPRRSTSRSRSRSARGRGRRGRQQRGDGAADRRGFKPHHSSGVPKATDLAGKFTAHDGPPTTGMLRNIPNKYMQDVLLDEIDDAGFSGTYDFFYLPMDIRNNANVGYAFINFLRPRDFDRFRSIFEGYKFKRGGSKKTSTVSPAIVQGLHANVQNLLEKRVAQGQFRPIVLKDGRRVELEDAARE